MTLPQNSIAKCSETGLCRLTMTRGPYVKSHIIPASLTRLPADGKKIVQAGIGIGIKRRFVSWYDNEIVTRAGEDILEFIDTSAISSLRAHKLIWSSWGSDDRLKTNDLVTGPDDQAFRFVKISEAKQLQLFFLSIVWRSAISQRSDFSYVHLSQDHLGDIRQRVHAKDPGTWGDYPVQLFQITSKGILHNRVPILERKIVELETGDYLEMDYVRIYFDGLVAHVHLALRDRFDERYLGTCLRSNPSTLIFAYEFENSRTAENIKEMVATVVEEDLKPKFPFTEIATVVRAKWKT